MKHYFKNPRQITQKQIKDLEYSLLKFGDLSGIVHDLNSDEIIGGNQRMEIFGLSRGIIDENIRLDETYEEPDAQGTIARGKILWKGFEYTYRQVKWDARMCEEANIRANHDGGSFDYDILANQWELEDLLSYGFEKAELGMGGFNFDEPIGEDPGPQIDKAEELREKWHVETGQLWRLGEHRIICGDCTDRAVVERVMGGEKADCTVTDPPYGVGVDYGIFKDTPENVKELIHKVMPIILEKTPAAILSGVMNLWEYPRPKWIGTWVHPAAMAPGPWGFNGNNPILYYGDDPYLKIGKGSHPDSVVMASDREGVEGHPTPKPIKVWDWLIERMTTKRGQIVFEPFSGSGTTIISCERLGRVCIAIELDPAYVAVAIQRWVDMTGGTPELIIDIVENNSNVKSSSIPR